jgi:hypothetical protein
VTRHWLARTAATLLPLGCAGGRSVSPAAPNVAPAPLPSLDAMLRADLASDTAFAWSAARRLVWSDFQGAPPAGGAEGARTAYTLYYAWKCRGQAFKFRVIAGFRPRQAWVKAAVLNDAAQSRSVLGHEQTHFDLVEVNARRMRRDFAELSGACGKTDGELTAIAQRLVREEKAEQRRYDDETDHGLLPEQQAAWTADVSRRLRL